MIFHKLVPVPTQRALCRSGLARVCFVAPRLSFCGRSVLAILLSPFFTGLAHFGVCGWLNPSASLLRLALFCPCLPPRTRIRTAGLRMPAVAETASLRRQYCGGGCREAVRCCAPGARPASARPLRSRSVPGVRSGVKMDVMAYEHIEKNQRNH